MKKFTIFYMRPRYFRTGSCRGERFFNKADLAETHVELKTIEAKDIGKVFHAMQGEVWSPNGEARSLIAEKKLGHTSMSCGDIIRDDETGEYIIVAMLSFVKLLEDNPVGFLPEPDLEFEGTVALYQEEK